MNIKTEIKEYGFPVTHNCVRSEARITELEAQLAAAQSRLVAEEELNVRNAASASLRVAALEAEIMGMRAEIDRWKQAYAAERERNLNNVANAQLQIDELKSEYQTWRMACGKARERSDAAAAEMQAMVSRLTTLEAEWQTIETYDKTADGVFEACARRLREAISGEEEK